MLQDECTEVLTSLVPHMGTIIEKYGNQQAVSTFNPNDHQRVDPPEAGNTAPLITVSKV